jgi:hypothetical protein
MTTGIARPIETSVRKIPMAVKKRSGFSER